MDERAPHCVNTCNFYNKNRPCECPPPACSIAAEPVTQVITAMKRDARIIDALHVARYALVIHNGLPFTCEGETHRMDFESELAKIDAVMTMLGIDLSEPLPAPVKGDDDE